jgi:signal transduction histidine kinase
MDQPTPSMQALCEALIAHDACATVVLDAAERILACNAAARAVWKTVDVVGRPLAESGLPQRVGGIRKGIDAVRGEAGVRPIAVDTPDGAVTVAPLLTGSRVAGFVIRRSATSTDESSTAEVATIRAELEATRRELERAAAETVTITEELQTANDDLQQRLEDLNAAATAERYKDQFLAMLAHELRTPLAPILSAAQILKRQALDNPMVQRAREVVERQALHQARLLDDLLDVSRITRGKLELRRRTVSLAAAVSEALEATRGLMQAKSQRIAVALPEQPLFVDADPTRLTQILVNLLNNATKYTHPGGRLGISCRGEGAEAVVIVRDDGRGIPREMLSRIFEPFAQIEPATPRAQGGLGIGLTLVKNLTELHGGSVVARSGGPGHGSEFEVRLPTVATASRDDAPVLTTDPGRAARVLVVEDNTDTRDTLRRVLELDGHQVEEAADGLEAVERAAILRPEVVLVDIGLPGLDGFEVARRLRASLGSSPLLIALTGYGQPEDRRRSRDAGFDVHLVKPVTPEQLAAALGSRGGT